MPVIRKDWEGYNTICTGEKGFIPAPGVVKVQVIYDQHGSKVENVYNVRSGDTITAASLTRIKDKFITWLTTYWRPLAGPASVVYMVKLTGQNTASDVDLEWTPTSGIGGTSGTQNMPGNVTLAIRWLTGHAGRSYRGRTYRVGLPINFVNGNYVIPSGMAGFITNYGALLTTLTGGAVADHLCVVSYCSGGAWRTTAVVNDVTTMTVDQNVDSQRRRLTGRGT